MNAAHKRRLLSAIVSGAACLLAMPLARAMPIPEFDKMDLNNQKTYIVGLLQGAYQGLNDRGQTDQAQKLLTLFSDRGNRGGFTQFEKNLEAARMLNKDNAKDPKVKPYEVENALAVTLKDNGITVPVSFLLTINKDFKPSSHAK